MDHGEMKDRDHSAQESASMSRLTRRQLLRTGLAVGTPMIMTLAARPVFGGGPTVVWSAGTSANLASAEFKNLPKGKSPGWWKHKTWPTPYQESDTFYSIFGSHFPENGVTSPNPNKVFSIGGSNVKLMDITLGHCIKNNSDLNNKNNACAYHVVAALLNAADSNINYPYSPAGVIAIFNYGYTVGHPLYGNWNAIANYFAALET